MHAEVFAGGFGASSRPRSAYPQLQGHHSMLAIDVPKLRQQQDKSIGFVQAKALPFASH